MKNYFQMVVRLCAWPVLCALSVAACAKPPAGMPEKAAEDFYADHFVAPYYGAPDTARLAKLRPLISDTLATLLAKADAERTADIARAPNEKPRWVDGDIFVSLVEGPSAFYVRPGIEDGDGYKVPIAFSHQEPGDSAEIRWTDTAVVIAQRGKWVVDDMIFGSTWKFGPKGRLRENLAQ